MEKNDLIENWLTQETSAAEREEMERIMRLTESLEASELSTKENAWDQLMAKIEEAPAEKERVLIPEKRKSNTWLLWAVSTAAVLLIGYFSLFNTTSDDFINYDTGLAELTSHVLPDESQVKLNANSTVSFDGNSWSEAREITLSGEAFFEVTRGSAFTVSSPLGKVTVLGTSFNVYSRGNEFSVQCFSGKVKVEAKGQEVILTANQSAEIEEKSGRLVTGNFNPEKAATWRVGEFYFDATELKEVIAELERQFNIEIKVSEDISNRFYTGFFSTQSLTEALQLVFVPMGLNANVDGGLVTIE